MPNDLRNVLTDRRLWRGPGPWVAALFVLMNIGVVSWRDTLAGDRKANLTSGDVAAGDESGLRYDASFGEDVIPALSRIPDATKTRLTVAVGMSQMYTINDRRPGDQTISEHLDDALQPQGARAFGLAAPNMCHEEALFLLLTLLDRPATTPQVFLFGSCFDKYRNVDLRPGYLAAAKRLSGVMARWEQVAEKYRSAYPLATAKMAETVKAVWTEPAKVGEETSFEGRLRSAAAVVPVIEARKDLNAKAQIGLYQLRNRLLGITPTSKRPVIRSRYATNQEFLGLIADVAAAHGITFATYVIPLNLRAENPYVEAEYVDFKRWISEECGRRHVPYANLEGIVPTDEWGEFNGGPDFKHFRGEGHLLTAKALMDQFGTVLRGKPPEPRP